MLKKIAFTLYPVTDIERARQFYEKILGLKIANFTSTDKGHWAEYDLPEGGCFAITTYVEGVIPSANAGGTIAFEVENIKSFCTQLKKSGVTFKLDIFTTPVCEMAIILDSEGNSIILHQLKR